MRTPSSALPAPPQGLRDGERGVVPVAAMAFVLVTRLLADRATALGVGRLAARLAPSFALASALRAGAFGLAAFFTAAILAALFFGAAPFGTARFGAAFFAVFLRAARLAPVAVFAVFAMEMISRFITCTSSGS